MLKLGKKQIIIIAAASVVALLCGAGGFLFYMRSAGEKAKEPPEYYFSKSDSVSSVTDILGERHFEKVEVKAQEVPAATQTENVSETEAAAETVTEVSETEAEAESEALLIASVDTYRYYPEASVEEDVKSYMDYLMENDQFIDVSPRESVEASDTQREESTADSGSDAVYRLAGPSDDPAYSLLLTIHAETDSYTVTTVREKTPWNTYFANLWQEQKQELEEAKTAVPEETKATVQVVEEKVSGMSQEALELPEPVENYTFIANPGLMDMDGNSYYRVTAYKRTPKGTLEYACAYLVDYTTTDVDYRYFDATGVTESLKRS